MLVTVYRIELFDFRSTQCNLRISCPRHYRFKPSSVLSVSIHTSWPIREIYCIYVIYECKNLTVEVVAKACPQRKSWVVIIVKGTTMLVVIYSPNFEILAERKTTSNRYHFNPDRISQDLLQKVHVLMAHGSCLLSRRQHFCCVEDETVYSIAEPQRTWHETPVH